MRFFVILLLLVGLAYAAGARLQWQTVTEAVGEQLNPSFRKIHFDNGSYVVGAFVGETPSHITLRLGDNETRFAKSGIYKVEVLSQAKAEGVQSGSGYSFVTFRREDRLFPEVQDRLELWFHQVNSSPWLNELKRFFQQNR